MENTNRYRVAMEFRNVDAEQAIDILRSLGMHPQQEMQAQRIFSDSRVRKLWFKVLAAGVPGWLGVEVEADKDAGAS